jgi:hypothetical protein
MAEARAVNPLVEQFKRGGVPRDLLLLAAQGALPLKPVDLLELVHGLLKDGDAEIVAAANGTLASLPGSELLGLFKDRQTPPDLLGWAVQARPEKELREALIQNHSTPDEALQAIATTLTQELCELVVINQTRLLRSTPLLEALEANAGLSNDQKRRLRELRETFRIGEQEAPPPPPPAQEAPSEFVELPPEEPPPATEAEAVERYLSAEERQDEEALNAVQKIYTMTAAQKVIVALKGNRTERAILIRDPNRLVTSAVLGSPRVTEPEIEAFAAMRNVSDDVLRRIGANREWLKRYGVMCNLVKNPRTPIGISLNLVSRLGARDLKNISTDRNVPEVIRKTALKFVRSQH